MIEVEIKAKIKNLEDIRKRFEALKGKYKKSLIHEDTYFNMPKNLRDFKKTDEALRIRKSMGYNKNEKEAEKKNTNYITYKGKKIDKISKTREEIESKIEDEDKIREILKILGFREVFTVKKERELYDFNFKDNKIEVLIDYIPILKEYYIEVEAMIANDSQEEVSEAREMLFNFLSELNIKKEESITKSYLELISDSFRDKVNR